MKRREQHIDFKEGVNNIDLLFLHPNAMLMLAFVSKFAYDRGLPFRLTSLIRSEDEEKRVGASSRVHRDGRAFDFSIIGWDDDNMNELQLLMYHEFKHIAAISRSTRLPTPIIFHDIGKGAHGHVQCRR